MGLGSPTMMFCDFSGLQQDEIENMGYNELGKWYSREDFLKFPVETCLDSKYLARALDFGIELKGRKMMTERMRMSGR